MAEGTTSVQHRVSELVMVTLRPQKGTITTMSVMTMCSCVSSSEPVGCVATGRGTTIFSVIACAATTHARRPSKNNKRPPSASAASVKRTSATERPISRPIADTTFTHIAWTLGSRADNPQAMRVRCVAVMFRTTNYDWTLSSAAKPFQETLRRSKRRSGTCFYNLVSFLLTTPCERPHEGFVFLFFGPCWTRWWLFRLFI